MSMGYRNPKSMYNNNPEPIIIAIKAIILHTFGVKVRVYGLGRARKIVALTASSGILLSAIPAKTGLLLRNLN